MKKSNYVRVLITIVTLSFLCACSANEKPVEKNFDHNFTAQRNHAQSGRVLDYKGDIYFSVLSEITYDNQKSATHHGSIFRSDIKGDQLVKIADQYASFLTIHNDWLYFSSENLYRVRKDGGEIEHIISGRDLEFTIYKDKVYYVDRTLEDGIYESNLDGTSKKKIFEGGASDLTVQGDTLYSVRNSDFRLHAISLRDNESKSVIKDTVEQYCIDDEHVIYTGENLYVQSLSGEINAIKVDERVSTFNLQGEWIYYISASEGDVLKPSLYKARHDGSERVVLTDRDISYYDMEIYIAGEWLYLFNPYEADRFIRMNLEGGERQVLRLGKGYNSRNMVETFTEESM